MSMPERRPIPGWEGLYEVDTDGNVYSLSRVITRRDGIRKTVPGCRLRPGSSHGYPFVVLHRPGKKWGVQVHILVTRTFFGEPPPGHEVCHFDGDKTNNRLSNLRYDTRAANAADRERHGTKPIGEGHANSKLTDALVVEMRRRHAAGESYLALAKAHGLSEMTVWKAINGKTWKHVPFEEAA